VREKYCSDRKNKLKKTDYKPGEQAHDKRVCSLMKELGGEGQRVSRYRNGLTWPVALRPIIGVMGQSI
jgi:hypothetical protein